MNKWDFSKYEGAGNDFILIEDVKGTFPTTPDRIAAICNRRLGIGGDGLLLLQPSRVADIKMRIFNQDGSEAETCGNGLRCTLLHLGKSSRIETLAGISKGIYGPSMQVSLPPYQWIRRNIPLANNLRGDLINTGVPHLVIFTEDFLDEEIASLAKAYRNDPLFGPFGVNVNLAQIAGDILKVRTFERGLFEESFACGTGGAAVALAFGASSTTISFKCAVLSYLIDNESVVWIKGPARLSFQGVYACPLSPRT